jgi:hypothetical protein
VPIFRGEDFARRRRDCGNESTAESAPGDARVAIFASISTG